MNLCFSPLSGGLNKLVKVPTFRAHTDREKEQAEGEAKKDNGAPVSLHLSFQRCGGGHSEWHLRSLPCWSAKGSSVWPRKKRTEREVQRLLVECSVMIFRAQQWLGNATITHSHKADDIMLFRNCLCFHACESNAKPTIPPEIFPGVTNRSVPVSY